MKKMLAARGSLLSSYFIAFSQVVEILQKLYACGADDLGLNFINELTVKFCHCPKWVGRQAFAFICQVCKSYLKSLAVKLTHRLYGLILVLFLFD